MFRRHVLLCRKTLTKCINRRILIFEHVHHVSHDGIDVISESRICCNLSLRFCLRAFCGLRLCRSCLNSSCTYIWFHTLYAHGSFCDCSGLVQTECIDSCKCLDTVEFLYKCLFVCKYKCTEGQCNTGQKNKSLRNHSQDSGYHAHYGVSECIAYDIILLIKQQCTERHNNNTDHFQDRIQGIFQFGIVSFKFLCFAGDLCCVIILSYMNDLTARFS